MSSEIKLRDLLSWSMTQANYNMRENLLSKLGINSWESPHSRIRIIKEWILLHQPLVTNMVALDLKILQKWVTIMNNSLEQLDLMIHIPRLKALRLRSLEQRRKKLKKPLTIQTMTPTYLIQTVTTPRTQEKEKRGLWRENKRKQRKLLLQILMLLNPKFKHLRIKDYSHKA